MNLRLDWAYSKVNLVYVLFVMDIASEFVQICEMNYINVASTEQWYYVKIIQ